MKSYFIPLVLIIIAAIGSSVYSKNNINSFYSDTTLKCPVTGDDIQSEYVSFRYIDKDIKFCNEGCIMAFKKEPAKFTGHLVCMPCNDPDGKHDINALHNGAKYYFCSEGCKGKFEKKPDSYLEKFMK